MTTKLPPGSPKLTWKSESGDVSESGPGDVIADSSVPGTDDQSPEEQTRENLSKIAKTRGKSGNSPKG